METRRYEILLDASGKLAGFVKLDSRGEPIASPQALPAMPKRKGKQPHPMNVEAREDTESIIYVMRDGAGQIIYVGEAGPRTANRITYNGLRRIYNGFNGKIVAGYDEPYRWRQDPDLKGQAVDCLVFCKFDPQGLISGGTGKQNRKALEADVAFEIKAATNQWPLKLTGIAPHGWVRRTSDLQRAVKGILDVLRTVHWI